MYISVRKIAASGLMIVSMLAASFGSQKPSPGKKALPAKTQNAASAASAATPPVATPSLEQSPAVPPQVSYDAGALTILAKNSSLGSILQEVQTKTGATVDMPGSPAERVAGQFGPGPARDVLAALLNGSHFNYVLMGSPQNPNSLDRVVLIAKSAGADPSGVQTQTAVNSPRPGAFIPPNRDADEMNQQEPPEEMVEPEQNPEDQAGEQGPNAQPQIKTPQQLLQELQRQQQQPGAPGSPPPGAPGQPPQGASPQ